MGKQISLTVPEALLLTSIEYAKDLGYRNVQEFILDLMRKRVISKKNLERYREIERKMDQGIDVKTFSQEEALDYIRNL